MVKSRRALALALCGAAALSVVGCGDEGSTAPGATMIVHSGNAQSGLPSSVLGEPFVVVVARSSPDVDGHIVDWTIEQGDGTLSRRTSVSDLQGFASTRLTLGPTPGTHRVSATLRGSSQMVTFTATGRVP